MIEDTKDFNGFRLLVTPYQNKKLPVYRWYHFNHSFSRDLVWYLIDKFELNSQSTILDPFCGSGTTLLAAKQKEISAIGMDILPLSVFISNAKLQNYDTKKIEHKAKELDELLNNNANYKPSIPEIPILHKVFDEKTLFNIFAIRNWIRGIKDEKLRYFFLTVLLSAVEKMAYAKKDGGFLRLTPDKEIAEIKNAIFTKVNEMLTDIDHGNIQNNVDSNAFLGDARKISSPEESFDAVITSPPYLNRHDYTRVYILELAIGFLESENEIKELRYNTLRSHVEAKRIFNDENYIEPPTLKDILDRLKEKTLPNKQVIPMIEGYFEDMYVVLKEVARVTKRGGFAAFVIGDVRYGGILIPVGEILAEIGDSLGLVHQETIAARFRGNSPQQMGKFGRKPAKESIVIWRKS
jgi:DNA modification methylase